MSRSAFSPPCNSLWWKAGLFAVAALLAVSLGTRTAEASDARGYAADNPTLGGGYMYWKKAQRARTGARLLTTSVIQRRLSDGRERVLLKAHGSKLVDIYADGDVVAFAMEKTTRRPTRTRKGIASDRIYAMTAEAATPTLLLGVRSTTKLVDGPPETHCGSSARLVHANAAGQILISAWDIDCRRFRETDHEWLYSVDGSRTPFKFWGVFDSEFDSIQFGNLITNDDDSVRIVNLASGAKRLLKDHVLADQVSMNDNGWIASVSAKDESFDQYIRLFPPGASVPTVDFTHDLGQSSVEFCAGGFVEMMMPWQYKKQPMLITFRGLDGVVQSRTTGPDAFLGYDASCEGRHLTIAIRKWKATPVLFGYDL